MTRRGVALAVSLSLGACRPSGSWLEARWIGADTGHIAAPATLEWCQAGRYATIHALGGDTGLAIVVFPVDTALASSYTAADTLVDSLRPAARVVLRWTDRQSIQGFRSDSGTVVLRRETDSSLAGELNVRGRLVGGHRDSFALAGAFRRLVVRPAPKTCPVLVRDSGDAGVDSVDGNDVLPEGIRPEERGGGIPH